MLVDINTLQQCYQQCQLLLSDENYEQAVDEVTHLHQQLVAFSEAHNNIHEHVELLREIQLFIYNHIDELLKKSLLLKQQLQEINTASKMQKAYGQ